MGSKWRNALQQAKQSRYDEFYTRYCDIEREMQHYVDYNPDVFRDKIILCPCDDYEYSNFTKYFSDHFQEYGLKSLICTCIATEEQTQYTLMDDALPDTSVRGKYYIQTVDGIQTGFLDGDGDFASAEVTRIKDAADIVITNPPFSILQKFIEWLGDKNCMIVCPLTILKRRLCFDKLIPHIYHMGFHHIQRFLSTEGKVVLEHSIWLTTIPPRPQYPFRELTATYKGHESEYPYYDNYDAINVDKTTNIPKDFTGIMGVPLSFLNRWNPDQFEVLGLTDGHPSPWCPEAIPNKQYINPGQYYNGERKDYGTKLNTGSALLLPEIPKDTTYYMADNVEGALHLTFVRVLIRNKTIN